MVLYADAPITFFDEVTTGLDFETSRRCLWIKLGSGTKNKDATVLLVTHYYDETENRLAKLLI